MWHQHVSVAGKRSGPPPSLSLCACVCGLAQSCARWQSCGPVALPRLVLSVEANRSRTQTKRVRNPPQLQSLHGQNAPGMGRGIGRGGMGPLILILAAAAAAATATVAVAVAETRVSCYETRHKVKLALCRYPALWEQSDQGIPPKAVSMISYYNYSVTGSLFLSPYIE